MSGRPREGEHHASGSRDDEAVDLTDAALAQRLFALDEARRTVVLNALTPAQRREFEERWGIWAHGGQREPEGDWRVWLIRAGRGFGKTRAGAEWISQFAREHKEARIALVGGTADDVAKVMVEGPSGLVAERRRRCAARRGSRALSGDRGPAGRNRVERGADERIGDGAATERRHGAPARHQRRFAGRDDRDPGLRRTNR